MKLATPVFALGIALLGTGCPLLEVTAEVPEACMIRHDVTVEGVAPESGQHITSAFVIDDLSAFDPLLSFDPQLRFTTATVTATSGVTDLSFVASALIDVASGDPNSTLPTRTFYHCDHDCPSSGAALEIPLAMHDDVVPYIESGSLAITLDASGAMPSTAWTMDVELCVEGSATYSQ